MTNFTSSGLREEKPRTVKLDITKVSLRVLVLAGVDSGGPGGDVRSAGLRAQPLPGPGPRHRPQGGTPRRQPQPVRQVMDAARHSGHLGVSCHRVGQDQ